MSDVNVLNYNEQADETGDNKLVLGGSVKTSGGANLKEYVLTHRIADISGANNAKIVAPFAGTLIKIISSVSGDPGAEGKLSVKVDGGTSAGNVVIADGSGADAIDTLEPSANNVVLANSVITILSDATPSNAVSVELSLVFTRD